MPNEIESGKVGNTADDARESETNEQVELEESIASSGGGRKSRKVMIVVGLVLAVVALGIAVWFFAIRRPAAAKPEVKAEAEHAEEKGALPEEVELSPEALQAAKIEIEGVTQRPSVSLLRVTGTVETNPQQTQHVTPLVSGRVERVNVALGDRVGPGTVLAVISSPQVAEMRGKLREAMTRLDSAQKNLTRVQRSENRVAVVQAKARLSEAEATLKRTRRLIELNVGAGKDLVAAQTAYDQAKAEFDFQSNISLNREVQSAQAEVNLANAEATHLQQSLRAIGVSDSEGRQESHKQNISLVTVRAAATGMVIERLVNPGAGVEAGKPLFTVANVSTMWVIANVPEAQLGNVREGTPAEVRSALTGPNPINGRVAYIDPQLNEETRTGRVRIEMANPDGKFKAGMFVDVSFQAGLGVGGQDELAVPSSAVQSIDNRPVVFVPKEDEPGAFEVREVELGGEADGYHRVISGLKLGEKVVTKGSFTLKTQAQKGEMGEHGH